VAFLAALGAKVAQWAISKGVVALVAALKYLLAKKLGEAKTAAAVKGLEDAKTPEELSKAADDIIANF
jgi:hypothetical protein